jgi:hypothetical protein
LNDFAAQLDALEAQADDAESDAAWRQVERSLALFDAAIFEARTEARRALDEAEGSASKLGVLGRLNPFSEARRTNADARDEAQARLDALSVQQRRAERLHERLAAFDVEPFLRELVLKADKIQRGVAGSWPTKAAAVALAIDEDLDADTAIAHATALLSHSLAEDPRVFLAAAEFGRPIADAEKFLARSEKKDPLLAAAFLLGEREPVEAADLVREAELPAEVLPAAIAANGDRADLEARHYAFADRTAIVRSVALLIEAPVEDVRAALDERSVLDDDVAAFCLWSQRSPADAALCARRIRETARGDVESEDRIRRAAIASDRSAAACAAIVSALQQRFSGSWSSEAWIIAAALLNRAGRSRRRPLILL